jgi:hypothetical protein
MSLRHAGYPSRDNGCGDLVGAYEYSSRNDMLNASKSKPFILLLNIIIRKLGRHKSVELIGVSLAVLDRAVKGTVSVTTGKKILKAYNTTIGE